MVDRKKMNAMIERNGFLQSVGLQTNLLLRPVSGLPLLDDLLFWYSKRDLRKCMDGEENLDDILDTTGTYHDPVGAYGGAGKYRYLQAIQAREELSEMARRVSSHDPSTVMEIGTAFGGTLYVWTRFFENAETILSSDLDFFGREPLLEYFGSYSGASLHCLEGDSHSEETKAAVEQRLSGASIDFLYVDGDHSYEGIKTDFEMYAPLVADDGVVGFHDVENEETGMPKLWDELSDRYECQTVGGDTQDGTSGIVYMDDATK